MSPVLSKLYFTCPEEDLGENIPLENFRFFSHFERKIFGFRAYKTSPGFPKLQSTCPEEHFGIQKRLHVQIEMANSGGKNEPNERE